MEATKKHKELRSMMRVLEKAGGIEEGDAVMILCLLKTDEQREEMMQYMEKHPEAGTQELYTKTMEILKAKWVEPDQI